MVTYPKSDINRVKRGFNRANYDQEAIFAILDASPMCHMGYVYEGRPMVIPTFQWRIDDKIYVHASAASRSLKQFASGLPVCLTVSLMDGWVLARSPMHHSANYRSAVLHGNARLLDAKDEEPALKAMFDQWMKGRWEDCRGNHAQELKATGVAEFTIETASAKVRTGGPVDDEEDYDTVKCWAGVIPFETAIKAPEKDSRLDPTINFPDYLKDAFYAS